LKNTSAIDLPASAGACGPAALWPPGVRHPDDESPGLLALADGTIFRGVAAGAPGRACGEVVFNTAMTGYQEIVTDPSYHRQIVTLTAAHVGVTGTNAVDVESPAPRVAGLVVRDVPRTASSWRSREPLPAYLARHGIVAVAGVDTRRLTHLLREHGAQAGCLAAGPLARDEAACVAAAREFPGLVGADLAKDVTLAAPSTWSEGQVRWLADNHAPRAGAGPHVVAYDFGVKHSILRLLVERGCRVTVVPATTTGQQTLALAPDGVFLSNGPGDPEPVTYAQAAIRELVAAGLPVFGICLGHQLLCLALGARTLKMKFGHHGANHPVRAHAGGRVLISSQNHGFAVDPDTLPDGLRPTHVSLFDGSLQGVELVDRPVFSFQGHPEASPGPHDVEPLFDRFARAVEAHRAARQEPAPCPAATT
jgi:carbamoyl-phosphate synthase small subunit